MAPVSSVDTPTAELIDTAVRQQAAVEQAAAMAVTTALARAGDVSDAAEAVNDAPERSTGLARTAGPPFDEDGVCRLGGWLHPLDRQSEVVVGVRRVAAVIFNRAAAQPRLRREPDGLGGPAGIIGKAVLQVCTDGQLNRRAEVALKASIG
jgi:hypothetical protein